LIFPASLGGDCMPRGTYEPTVIVDTTNLTEEEWLDYRRKGIGGSDASIIYGASHFRTGRELYYDKLDKKLRKVAVKSRDKIPYTTIDGTHDDKTEVMPEWWTNGFWGGLMWLMYKETGCEEYKTTAIRSEELLDAAFEDYSKLHHDVGFMWHILSGANYKITGDKKAYNKNS